MLNCNNFDELLASSPEKTKDIFYSLLTESSVPFSQMESFPDYHGLYFVFLDNTIVYVGKADKQSIKDRCKQYVSTSTGATLRKKIELVRMCKKDEAITYIRGKLQAKFISIANIEQIPVFEDIAIWAFQPKLNVIKPKTFSYALTSCS